jgi:hypothetical protein
LPLQLLERRIEIVDSEGDVPVPRAQLVRSAVVVERDLELLVLTGNAEEVVGRRNDEEGLDGFSPITKRGGRTGFASHKTAHLFCYAASAAGLSGMAGDG